MPPPSAYKYLAYQRRYCMDIYKDIASRTGGDIYVGVVGPVRTGKSTFISNFMQKLVTPNITDAYSRARAVDELPQSADGKTIMTTQPRFVPGEAVEVNFREATCRVRLIDCVGYLVEGALGHTESDRERMVKTPWSKTELPFTQAAELGTHKVVTEHSTIAVVVTCDGSFTGIEREAYIRPEERVIKELKENGKPFAVVYNTTTPSSPKTQSEALLLSEKYGVEVLAVDVLNMGEDEINSIMLAILNEFPVRKVEVTLPDWLRTLPASNPFISEIISGVRQKVVGAVKMRDCSSLFSGCTETEYLFAPVLMNLDMSNGVARYAVNAKQALFYRILSDIGGTDISGEFTLIKYIAQAASNKEKYEKVKDALEQAEATGYGAVMPVESSMSLDPPEIMKQNGRYGVRLRATAPSLHIMRVDVTAEVAPIVGTEEQSKYMLSEFENDPQALWNTNMFGKTLAMLAQEGLNEKLSSMSPDLYAKIQRIIFRILNEDKKTLICLQL